MSLWKRLQRIGMKAAKFQFTVSLEKLHIKFDKDYQPKAVIIVFTRRGRRCSSQPVTLQKSPTDKSTLINEWALPENLEVLTTLYRNEKDISFEDKEWTFQVEDVCMSSSEFKEASISATTRRRVLATRSLNLAEFASTLPTQNNLKINLRAASKKVSTATLFFTLHGLMLRCGEATDEDMISVASSMSLTYAPPSAYGARWGSESPTPPFAPVEQAGGNPNLRNDFANISSQLQALERCPDLREVDEEEEDAEADTNVDSRDYHGGWRCRGLSVVSFSHCLYSQPEPASQLVDGGGQAKVTSQTGQDLLTWCQEVTASYPGVKVKDLTLCFRSGLALCAIIHHFQPEAIGDFERVKVLSPTERVRLAFDVASRFGVARVFLDPCEVVRGKGGGPDRLTMMTYLHQLRTRLTAMADRPVAEEDDKATDEPTVDPLPLCRCLSLALLIFDPNYPSISMFVSPSIPSLLGCKHLSGEILVILWNRLSRNCLYLGKCGRSRHMNRCLCAWAFPQTKIRLIGPHDMRHQQYKPRVPVESVVIVLPSSSLQVSGGGNASERYEHLLTKARNLLLESKTTAQPGSIDLMASHFPENSTENQPSADPTHGNANEQSDQLAETPQAGNLKVRKLKLSNLKLFADGMEPHLTPNHSSPQKSPQPSRPSYSKSTQLPPFPCACTNAVVSCLAPGSPKDEETNPFQQTRLSPFSLVGSQKQNPRTGEQRKLRLSPGSEVVGLGENKHCAWIPRVEAHANSIGPLTNLLVFAVASEAAAVAAEQEALDREAPSLERRLREVMDTGSQEEEMLMRRWFQLVSRRNALVHRAYQLSIMEKETDLERTTALLNAELRELLEKEDNLKTSEDRVREELLLREVVEVVNERNEIIQELDYQEQAFVNEVELGLKTDAITQQAFRSAYATSGGDAGNRSCAIQ
ncbi:unnamed protein product [Mesocestoides corti]|uniref:Calponin-homology (CH) domain-containing protein n=1 Tax=Mesocestoides corti TaxID=53468 RepID=A0A0R3U1U8_MESCO|nr:unnamed protein product [Mesocestoides corti]